MSDDDADAETESGDEPQADAGSEPDPDADTDADTESGDEPEADTGSEPDPDADDGSAPTEADLRDRLETLEAAVADADTEAELDAVEADLDGFEADLEAADLPEPDGEDADGGEDGDDEEEPSVREELTGELASLRETVEGKRGPYAADVVADLESAVESLRDTRWTEDGAATLETAVGDFFDEAAGAMSTGGADGASAAGEDGGGRAEAAEALDAAGEALEATTGPPDPEVLADALEAAAGAIDAAGLHPDRDAAAVGTLADAADDLAAAVEDAEEYDDLSVRGQLAFEGFYDVLEHRKDFPPEWNAVKVYEKRNEPGPILSAFEKLDSEFMQRHCMESLKRIGAEAALPAMTGKAQRRDRPAVEVLGKIGSDEPVDMLVDFVGTDSDPTLQRVTLRALGEIGSEAATQDVADRLVAEHADVRSAAARALGMIGDTRAVDPLAEVLAEDDDDAVRASAAWALYQIGTERALRELRGYADDRAYVVQAEAEKAVGV